MGRGGGGGGGGANKGEGQHYEFHAIHSVLLYLRSQTLDGKTNNYPGLQDRGNLAVLKLVQGSISYTLIQPDFPQDM